MAIAPFIGDVPRDMRVCQRGGDEPGQEIGDEGRIVADVKRRIGIDERGIDGGQARQVDQPARGTAILRHDVPGIGGRVVGDVEKNSVGAQGGNVAGDTRITARRRQVEIVGKLVLIMQQPQFKCIRLIAGDGDVHEVQGNRAGAGAGQIVAGARITGRDGVETIGQPQRGGNRRDTSRQRHGIPQGLAIRKKLH